MRKKLSYLLDNWCLVMSHDEANTQYITTKTSEKYITEEGNNKLNITSNLFNTLCSLYLA